MLVPLLLLAELLMLVLVLLTPHPKEERLHVNQDAPSDPNNGTGLKQSIALDDATTRRDAILSGVD